MDEFARHFLPEPRWFVDLYVGGRIQWADGAHSGNARKPVLSRNDFHGVRLGGLVTKSRRPVGDWMSDTAST